MNRKAQEWVRAFGPRKVRAALPAEHAVTDSSIYGWLWGRMKPSYPRAKALVEIAKADTVHGGKKARLTVDDFLADHEPPTTTNEPGKGQNV